MENKKIKTLEESLNIEQNIDFLIKQKNDFIKYILWILFSLVIFIIPFIFELFKFNNSYICFFNIIYWLVILNLFILILYLILDFYLIHFSKKFYVDMKEYNKLYNELNEDNNINHDDFMNKSNYALYVVNNYNKKITSLIRSKNTFFYLLIFNVINFLIILVLIFVLIFLIINK